MEFEDLQTFVKRRKEKKLREQEERKQLKIDHFFKKIKKEKDSSKDMPLYDGDDEEDSQNHVIVNPVEVEITKEILNSSNEGDSKLNGTSKEVYVSWDKLSDMGVQSNRETETLQSDLNVTSMAEDIPNTDTTLMGEIQNAIFNIIPDSGNTHEVNVETTEVQERSDSAVQSRAVEDAHANPQENLCASGMEHAPNLACAANGAKTNIAPQSAIMETLNEEEQLLQQTTLNTQQNVFPTYASCETQTIVSNHSTNATQTDLVVLQPSATQTD